MTLKKALEKIDASVESYRALLRDNPEDYDESARLQQESADLLDEAQTLGMALKDSDAETFWDRFSDANVEIQNLETKRLQGGDDEEDPDGEDVEEPEDFEESESPESEEEKAEAYSSMASPPDEDE